MNGPEHQTIVNLALAAVRAAGEEVPAALAAGMLDSCMLPDQVAIPLLRHEDGSWRQYFPKTSLRFNFEQDLRDLRALMPKHRFYLPQVLKQLRAGNLAAASRFLGVYSHYVGDFAQPAHYYELHLARLLPPPASRRNCNYHRLIEDVGCGPLSPQRPARVLATSAAELEFRLAQPFAALHRQAVAAVLPMLRALYRRRPGLAAQILKPVVQTAGALFGDICLTLWRLAGNTVSAADKRRLRRCPLASLPPTAFDAEFNFSQLPLVDWITRDAVGRAEPFSLHTDTGVRRVHGVCVIPHALPIAGVDLSSFLEYHLPAGVFARFTADVGLLASCPEQAGCSFAVIADGRTRWQSPTTTAVRTALHVDLDISDVRRLRLFTPTDGRTDRLAYPIWANPTLWKPTRRRRPSAER